MTGEHLAFLKYYNLIHHRNGVRCQHCQADILIVDINIKRLTIPLLWLLEPLQDGDIDEFLPNFEAYNQVNFDQDEDLPNLDFNYTEDQKDRSQVLKFHKENAIKLFFAQSL
jgi:hypothetical protein